MRGDTGERSGSSTGSGHDSDIQFKHDKCKKIVTEIKPTVTLSLADMIRAQNHASLKHPQSGKLCSTTWVGLGGPIPSHRTHNKLSRKPWHVGIQLRLGRLKRISCLDELVKCDLSIAIRVGFGPQRRERLVVKEQAVLNFVL